jgi:hypothetical protein
MEFKDLIGEHKLSGVDEVTIDETKKYYDDSVNAIRFILDKNTYQVVEDPADGYRSYCNDIKICDQKVSNTFKSQKVIGIMDRNKSIITFFDSKTGKPILEIGTDNADDYYPVCVMNYHPENMFINQTKKEV